MCHWTQQAKLCKTASPKIFLHLTNTKSEELSLINEPEVACDNNLMLFWLPACLGISYPTAKHFTFKPHAPSAPPPKKNRGTSLLLWQKFCPGCREKGKGSPCSITERRVPELIAVLGSQPAGDVSHKPGGMLPLLSGRPAVTLATLKRAATSFTA